MTGLVSGLDTSLAEIAGQADPIFTALAAHAAAERAWLDTEEDEPGYAEAFQRMRTAQATGLGQQLLQQMLPVIASMIMGGMFKQSINQLQGSGGNPLGEIIEQMMRQGAGGGQARPRQAPQPANPFENPFGKVLQDMFGGGAGGESRQPEPQQKPDADNPLGRIFEEMLRGGGSRPAPETARKTKTQPEPGERPRNPYDDLFGQMFETGARQRDEYQKSMESIFDQFTRGMDRYR